MAITERDYILVENESGKRWLMLRSEAYFHLVEWDDSLSENDKRRLMLRYPCTQRDLLNMGFRVTALRRDQCRFLTIEGWAKGDKIRLWPRDFILGDAYSKERLEQFFCTQQIRWDVRLEPWGPSAHLSERIVRALNAAAVACGLLHVFTGGLFQKLTAIGCLLTFLAAVGVTAVWPLRFDPLGGKQSSRYHSMNTGFAIIIPLICLAWTVIDEYTFTNWWLIGILTAVTMAAVGGILWYRSPYMQSNAGESASLVLFLVLFGFGIAAQVNALYPLASESHAAEVLATDVHRGLRSNTYYCTVLLPDGTEQELSIGVGEYRAMDVGDEITATTTTGLLGIEYMTAEIPR